jgi:hypothetical protein
MPPFGSVPPTNRLYLVWKLNQDEIQGSPIFAYPAESFALQILVLGTNAPSSPNVTVYKGRSDVTSTVMSSGSHSVSGQVITTKPVTASTLVANAIYTFMITATIAGNVEQRKLVVRVLDPKAA